MGLLSYAMSLKTGGFDRPLSASRGMLSRFGSGVASVTGKLAKLTVGLGAIVGPAAAVGIAFKSFNAAADLESTQVALRTLVGDIELADQTLNKVRRLAASTPFQFPELAKSARSLVAFKESAETVPDTLRRIGDVAAGVQAPIQEMAILYGKARADGILFTETLDQMRDRGINVMDLIGQRLGKTTAEMKKLASEGKITFPLLEQAFIDLTSEGGQFFNMMKAQSATTNGLMSTLKDSINEIFLVIGQPLNDAFKPILTGAIERSKLFGIQLQGIIGLFREAGSQGQLGSLIGASLQVGAIKFVNTISSGFRGSVAFLGATIPRIFSESSGLIFNNDLSKAIHFTFLGAGDLIKAGIFSGAKALADVVAKLPGVINPNRFFDFEGEAQAARDEAGRSFFGAKNRLSRGNLGSQFQKFTDGFSDAMSEGAQAFREATDEPLVNGGPALRRWEKLAKDLNPESAQRILNPDAFVPKELTEEGAKTAPGIKAAIEAATRGKEIEKKKSDKQISALDRNTAALARKLAGPQLLDSKGKDGPAAGGSVFSVAESLARQFGRTKDRGGKSFNQFINDSLGGRKAVRDFARKNKISLADARERLVALAGGANPAKRKKPAGQDPQVVAARAMLDVVKNIDGNLENLAVA